MRQNDRRRRLFKTFTACLLAVAMLLSNVGAMDVWAAAVKKPTVDAVLYDATSISGANLAKARINKKTVIATVHVSLKDSGGTEKANLSVTPTTGTTWKVDLPEGKKVAKGDTVTVYQQIGEDKSLEVNVTAKPSKASTVTLTMPTGEIWIEQYVANIVNADEKAEAIDLLKKANPTIAKDIKSVEFKITGIDPNKVASYTVTYTDKSKTGEIQAPDLTIKEVTETSRSPEIDSIKIVDNVVKGKLAGPGPFDGIKVQLVLNVNKNKLGQYCNENKCTVDKDSSDPIDVTLQNDGTFSYSLKAWESLELDQIVGVSVKEPHKFVSCSTTTVKPVIPEKTNVKDPRKLTAEDKKAIDAAIRKAYIVNGESKLPNGTGDWEEVPAVIQIDDSGNVKIFNGNDVAGTWDSEGTFVPGRNSDGSVKLNKGAEPTITIQGKDLLKNIKPDAPTLALSKDKKSITITPNEKDTDAKIIAVSYKDKDGKDQTTTATKADDGTWSITKGEGSVDQNGVVTLPKDKAKGGTDVTATVTDKGGVADDDKTPLTSDPGTLTLEETKADKVKALGGLDPVVMKKWVGDEIKEGFWKDGVKAKDSTKETDVNKLLAGATFTDVTETKRSTEKSGEFVGKIKVTFEDGSELVVENQKLMVCDHVTSTTDPKLPNDALDVQFKLGEGVKVEDKDPNTGAVTKTTKGDKDNPVVYKEYKVKPGTDLSTYIHPTLKKTIFDLIDEKADEGYTEPVWKGQDANNANNFVAAAGNSVFTATATKTFKVTVKPNGGTGDEKVEIKKKDETFKLPAANTFTPPNENQEFSGWKIGDDTNLKQPETEITITGDTEINAIWKPIEFKVDFKAGEGASGSMEDKTVTKGSEYELPTPTFTAPKDKVFAGWKVGDQEGVKQAKERIIITGNVTLTATWKAKLPADEDLIVTFNGNGGTGSMTDITVKKGAKYKLPESKFTPPAGKVFAGWMIGDSKEVKAAGTDIKVDGPIKLTAVYKDAPKPEAPADDRPIYKASTLIIPNRTPEPVEPAKEMEIGRHIRYLYGYEDRTVRPQGKITRAEAAALIARLAELDMSDKSKPDFADTPSAWYNSAINIMVKKDLVFGDKNGNFRPNEPITRGEFARALLYIDRANDKVAPFADVKGHQFEAAINQAFGNGRINGYPDGTFRPDDYIQRAEAARMLNQYANRGTTLEGMAPVAKDLAHFTDINESHWAYCEIMEAANSHEYQRVKGTQAETWLKILYDDMKK